MAEPLDWMLVAAALVTVGTVLAPRSAQPHARIVQVMGFLLLGVLTSLIWLRLDSVDVSLAEAALGGGLLGGALVYVAAAPREDQPGTDHLSAVSRWLTPILGLIAGAVLVISLSTIWFRVEQTMPQWSDPLQGQLPATGVEHEITGVLLAFRAYDTLLESAILMLAALAALSLRVRCVPVRRINAPERSFCALRHTQLGGHSNLNWMVRLTAPALLLTGLWLLFAGSSDSGGAFQSGAVLAALLILLRVSGILRTALDRRPSGTILTNALVAGVVLFALVGLLGPLMGQPWLSWDPTWAFAAILTVEVLLTAGIAAGLYALYLGLEAPR